MRPAKFARLDCHGNRLENHQKKDRSDAERIWRRMYAVIRSGARGNAKYAIHHYDMAIGIAAASREVHIYLLMKYRDLAMKSLYQRDMDIESIKQEQRDGFVAPWVIAWCKS